MGIIYPMKFECFYRCDLCQKKFDTGREVKNDVTLMNGTYSRIFGDVCDDCLRKTANLIDEHFPRNKTIVRKEESMAHTPITA